MSQYLAKFYCGNKKNLCNYNEPIEYKKMLDRQFNLEQYDIVNNCKGYGKQKGYCCDKNGKDANKIMKKHSNLHLKNIGGEGALRELTEIILKSKGLFRDLEKGFTQINN